MENKTSLNKTFSTIGATNHSNSERHSEDYYATDPKAVEMLLELENFNPTIWEPACGEGHISKVLETNGYNVISTDLVHRGYEKQTEEIDFLKYKGTWTGDIITNPPYKYGKEFVEKALEVCTDGSKIAMFLKLLFLESKKRRKLFDENPPKVVYVSSSRLQCAKNGDFENVGKSAIAYCWFVWEKGFKGDPIIKWFN